MVGVDCEACGTCCCVVIRCSKDVGLVVVVGATNACTGGVEVIIRLRSAGGGGVAVVNVLVVVLVQTYCEKDIKDCVDAVCNG